VNIEDFKPSGYLTPYGYVGRIPVFARADSIFQNDTIVSHINKEFSSEEEYLEYVDILMTIHRKVDKQPDGTEKTES